MPSTKELRRRIKSVKNTSQITKAMQMVSATKMRKAQNQALSGRPYNQALFSVLSQIIDRINPATLPLLSPNGSEKCGILLLSTDKGLCGALNSNLFRALLSETDGARFKGKELVFYTIGKKGRDFIVRSGKDLAADFESSERISFSKAVTIRKFLVSLFLEKEIGGVYLLYPHFISTLRQQPKLVKLLPIEKEEIINFLNGFIKEELTPAENEFLLEPNPESVLDYALLHFLETQIYQALLETKASEHSATMIAMQNATDNAKELVEDLQLAYNQIRQNAITTELLEITSAGAALE